MTEDDVTTLSRCIAVGGVALFPSDTVYGLATEPDSKEGVYRLCALKRRPPDQPSAVMFFDIELALAALAELGPRTERAVTELLPGPVTLIVPNPARRYPLACGIDPERLGVRVPRLDGELEALSGMRWPVLQSSANRTGGPEALRLDDVDAEIRSGVDMQLDGGERSGQASTVLDLGSYELDGKWEILRDGPLSEDELRDVLS